ncbi:MAG: hypothetical protein CL920_32235 [Deltaproteobacteria bacterium]|nr:hypothetical protein [Deltaproteobacteria bacterium]MBU53389.1 hypothetical protein [Deltaproteobacteria bacterium]
MEPQTRHGKEPWRRQCGDESRRLRFHLQPLRMYLFPTLFFSWSSLIGPLAKRTYNIEVGHKARPYEKNATSYSCVYFARGPLIHPLGK